MCMSLYKNISISLEPRESSCFGIRPRVTFVLALLCEKLNEDKTLLSNILFSFTSPSCFSKKHVTWYTLMWLHVIIILIALYYTHTNSFAVIWLLSSNKVAIYLHGGGFSTVSFLSMCLCFFFHWIVKIHINLHAFLNEIEQCFCLVGIIRIYIMTFTTWVQNQILHHPLFCSDLDLSAVVKIRQ